MKRKLRKNTLAHLEGQEDRWRKWRDEKLAEAQRFKDLLDAALAKAQAMEQALEFYATYTPRQHPEGYYEMHVAPGEGGEVRFGTFARLTLAKWRGK